jgi:hypothetical protein
MPAELRACLQAGGNTTLMVWADLDHDMANGDHLKAEFRKAAGAADLAESDFDRAVFIFAKDRLENWIQYLTSGGTDETIEGPRVTNNKEVAKAARKLAEMCLRQVSDPPLPDSLAWSCHNWKKLVKRMKDA